MTVGQRDLLKEAESHLMTALDELRRARNVDVVCVDGPPAKRKFLNNAAIYASNAKRLMLEVTGG